MGRTFVVVGASTNPARYSNRALRSLRERGFDVIPVHPIHQEIEGLPTAATLGEVSAEVDTVTMYVNPERGKALIPDIIRLKPKRVILNPGADSIELAAELRAAGLNVVEGCTLVMIGTGEI